MFDDNADITRQNNKGMQVHLFMKFIIILIAVSLNIFTNIYICKLLRIPDT